MSLGRAIVCGVLALASAAAAPEELFDLARGPLRVYTDRDGLPENTIFDIEVDPSGRLWVATENGPAYYDGRRWHALELPPTRRSRFARALLAASDGSIWLAMDESGLLRHADGQWTLYDKTTGFPANLGYDVVEQIEPGKAPVIWASTEAGLARIEGGRWSVIDQSSGLHDRRVSRLLVSRDKRTLWVGTLSGVTRVVDGRVDPALIEAPGAPRAGVGALSETVDADGNVSLWVASTNQGLSLWRDGRWSTVDLPHGRLFALHVVSDAAGETIWAGTYGDGLLRWRSGRATTFDSQWGLPSDVVRSVRETVSPEGLRTLWIGTQGGGLVRMSLYGWRAIDRRGGLPSNYVGPIGETRDADGRWSLWLGTNRGLMRLRDGELKPIDASEGVPTGEVNAMASQVLPDGTRALWATIGVNVVRYANGRWMVWGAENGLSGRQMSGGLGVDDDGVMWANAWGGGLTRFDGDVATTIDRDAGMFNQARALTSTPTPDGAALWINAANGLWRRERGEWVDAKPPPLPAASLTSLLLTWDDERRRRLWIGGRGSGGPHVLDLDRAGAQWVDVGTLVRAKLPDSIIDLRWDGGRNVYIYSTRGIVRLTPRASTADDPSEYAIVTFTTNDGLPSDRVNYYGGFIDHAGRVWAGTFGGAAYFDPASYVEDRTPKPLFLDRAIVEPGGAALQPGAELAHDANRLRFGLALLSTFRESESMFRTELDGFDPGPGEWTGEAQREVTNLPAGDYVFRGWGRDWAGNVSGPVELPFRIRPAPWNWWGAYVLYALAAMLLVYAYVRHRTRVLRRETEVLEARVAERTAELKASEERALEASRAKGSFLANMSHELRTPLNAILGFTQLMAREPDRSERDRQRLATLNRSGEHLLGLINDVLSLARIESGQIHLHPAAFDLRACVRQVEEMFRLRADEKGLRLSVAVALTVPAFVFGDEGKVRQILINLVGNAVKFTERGAVSLEADWQGGRATFVVADTGPGIAPHERDVVFEAFGQTQSGRRAAEGAGLGLSICAGFVAAMGGTIDVESDARTGTRFRVALDLPARTEGTSAVTSRVVRVAAGAQRRVLVVDDRAENREVLAELLAGIGLDVRHAADGAEAIELWRTWRPHAVFMDVLMPGVDGIAATREIRRLEAGRAGTEDAPAAATVVVAVSASAFDHDRAAVLAAGADEFVAKPVVEREVFDVLGRRLGLEFVHESDAQERAPALDPRDAARLAPEWRSAFRDALRRGDLRAAADLVDRIDGEAALVAALRARVDAFDVDALLEWVGET